MSSLIYTNQKSKLSKKQRAAQEQLIQEQRAIKRDLKTSQLKRSRMAGSGAAVSFRRDDEHIPSLDSGVGNAVMKAPMTYTGDKMIGIGQMHKSNAVPIFKQEDAEDIARMRR